MKHPVIIGAGGVASYLLPVLLKTFRPEQLTLVDKDILEGRNLDRQLFPEQAIGKNKARALFDVWKYEMSKGGYIIEQWFSDSTALPDDIDAIICCADNHEARHSALKRADALGIRAYIGGNEYLDSQAYVYHPAWKGTKLDPLVRYPNIATDETGSPFRCTGEAQAASPQLAIANMACAAKLLHLLWVWERWLPENGGGLSQEALNALPHELFSSLTEHSSL